METITFTDHRGKTVTRTYMTSEELVSDLRTELGKMQAKRRTTLSTNKRKLIDDNIGKLLLVIYNSSARGFAQNGIFEDPKLEIR